MVTEEKPAENGATPGEGLSLGQLLAAPAPVSEARAKRSKPQAARKLSAKAAIKPPKGVIVIRDAPTKVQKALGKARKAVNKALKALGKAERALNKAERVLERSAARPAPVKRLEPARNDDD